MIGLEPGSLFAGRYEIIRRIGAGGMGAVYLACDPNERDFKVALKLLYPGTLQSTQARERFRNEITASYRINHPNVVRAYEYFDAEDVQAFAMEYVDGGDLMERLREGAMSASEAARILLQIASALEAVHKAGIIHRDLKPENILINRKGDVKISDFGVARLRDSHTLTQAGSMVGTPKYLAPEYVETGECDGRGDIFAVGVMGYELISGTSPFGKDFKPNNILDRLTMHIPPLKSVAPECPGELCAIVEKAMSLKLPQRYQSASAMKTDLERHINGESLGFESPKVEEMTEEHEEQQTDEAPAIRGWLDEDDAHRNPSIEATQPFFHSDMRELLRPPARRSRVPAFAAVIAVSALVGALGFTSMLYHKKPNPLATLPTGIYNGQIVGLDGVKSKVSLGMWVLPKAVLALVGDEGCAAFTLSNSGVYECNDTSYTFSTTSITAKGASGTVIARSTLRRVGSWSVALSDPPSITSGKVASPPVTTKNAIGKANKQKSPTSSETQELNAIEERLSNRDISPEQAATEVLKLGSNKKGGSK